MANRLYDKGRENFLKGDISWNADDIRVVLVDLNDYTPDFVNDEFLSDVPALARVAISSSLTGKTTVAGVADANDVTFPLVTGDESEAIIIYQHTGVDATSRLIAYIDTVTGLPVIPNGGDIIVQWDNGANKIFKL
jgi:hypothetical protein